MKLAVALIASYILGIESFSPLFARHQLASSCVSKRPHRFLVLNTASDPTSDDGDDDDNFEDIELTSKQILVLRKEIRARRTKQTLPKVFLPEAESDGSFSGSTIASIVELLKEVRPPTCLFTPQSKEVHPRVLVTYLFLSFSFSPFCNAPA
jgi:hypothetical protein